MKLTLIEEHSSEQKNQLRSYCDYNGLRRARLRLRMTPEINKKRCVDRDCEQNSCSESEHLYDTIIISN